MTCVSQGWRATHHHLLGWSAVFALSAALATAACSPGPGGSGSAAAVPTPRAESQLSDPFTPYGISPAQQSAIIRALGALTARCLGHFGLRLPASSSFNADPLVVTSTSPAAISGWLSVASAQHNGYAPAAVPTGEGQLQPLDGPWTLSFRMPRSQQTAFTEVSAALRGTSRQLGGHPVPPGGCISWSTAELDGGATASRVRPLASDPDALLLYLVQRALAQTDGDGRVSTATMKWRSCMNAAGYSYQSPEAAEADPKWVSYASAGLSRQALVAHQVPVATADARCRAQVNYAGIRMAVFSAYARDLIASHQAAVRDYQARLRRMASKARSVAEQSRSNL